MIDTEAVKILITDTTMNVKTIIIISQGKDTMNIDAIAVKIIETTAALNTPTIIIIGITETIITTVVTTVKIDLITMESKMIETRHSTINLATEKTTVSKHLLMRSRETATAG